MRLGGRCRLPLLLAGARRGVSKAEEKQDDADAGQQRQGVHRLPNQIAPDNQDPGDDQDAGCVILQERLPRVDPDLKAEGYGIVKLAALDQGPEPLAFQVSTHQV